MEDGASGLIGQNAPLLVALGNRHGTGGVTIRNQVMEVVPVQAKPRKQKYATRMPVWNVHYLLIEWLVPVLDHVISPVEMCTTQGVC